MIGKFIHLLNQSDAGLDDRQIAEALWLSRHITIRETAGMDEKGRESDSDVSKKTPTDEQPAAPPQTTQPAPDEQPIFAAKQPPDYEGGGGVPVSKIRAPGVASLPAALMICRALRPFARRVESNRVETLDEAATVQLSAEISDKDRPVLLPVMRPAKERWFEVAVIAEDTPTMAIWRPTIGELVSLLGRHGAFRDARLWLLRFGGQSARLVSTSGAEFDTMTLNDSCSRRLTMLVSDCVSHRWRDGSMANLISEWAETMPVVIGHMLSKRLWRRTGLGEPTAEVKAVRPGATNKDLIIANIKWWDRIEENADADEGDLEGTAELSRKDNRIACPVISLDPKLISEWAKMVMSPGRRYPAALLSPDQKPSPVPQKDEPAATPSAESLIERYRMMVSPEAFDLAVYLSFMPLALPVMRVIQRAMIPSPRQEQLAEFLMGGLLKRKAPDVEHEDHESIQYEFHDGVRELLRSEIRRYEVAPVLSCVSEFVGRSINSVHDFIAWAQDLRGMDQAHSGGLPFAQVGLDGLEQLGYPQYAVSHDRISVDETTSVSEKASLRAETHIPKNLIERIEEPAPIATQPAVKEASQEFGEEEQPSVESLIHQADSLLTQDKFAEAESLYRRAIGILPADNRAWRGLAEIVRHGLGNEETLRIMLGALRHSYHFVRKAAAEAIGDAGITSPEAIRALLRAMLDESNLVREAVLKSLRILGNENSTAVSSALIETLRDKTSEVRAKAAVVLGDIGEKSAISGLRKALRDEDARVRRSALNALEKLGAATEKEIGRARIFLSHASADHQSANDIYGFLAIHGFEVESSDYSLSDRRERDFQFEKWIWKYDLFLVCLSRNNFEEMNNSEGRIPSEMHQPDISLISVRLEECELPEGMEGWRYVNFYEGDGKDRLLRAIRSELRRRRHSSETQSHRLHSRISEALTDKLATADVLNLVDQLREMTAIEVCRVMNEAGITYVAGDEGEKLFVNDSTVECDPVSQGGKQARQLSIEAQRRCLVIKSPEFIRSLIPLRGLNSNLIAETERIAQAVLEAVDEPSVPNFITLDTDNQRIAALRTAADLSERFPDGLLFIDLEGRKISQTELRLACLNPFVKLGDDPVGSQLLVEERFIEVFSQKRVLIIFDKVGDLRGLESFPRLPRGTVMIVIRWVESRAQRFELINFMFQAANRNRQAGLSRYDEASKSYAQAIAAYDEALRRDPDDVQIYSNKGNALQSLGDLQARLSRHDEASESYAKAIAAYDEALRRAPGDVSAHNNKGNALTSRGKLQAKLSWHDEASESYARATAVYDEALRRAPDKETTKKPGQTLRQHGTAGTSAGTPPQVRC